ncbi:MAG: Fatty acid desaturase [Labilithrix sp.]|jgi:stearoyl-CoA desaturase (delta-9 desaturase)|nr:Fatty acid desaturase [Labilithrix sp.]
MKKRDFGWLVSLPFYAVHVAAVVGVALVGFSWQGVALAVALYYVRMFGVTGGYHRYFSHRTYRTSRAFQLLLAILAQSSVQKGALWWAAHHRDHHKYSDTPRDPHSYRDYGFWYSHVGWILSDETEETDYSRIADLARYPELRWLNKFHVVPAVVLAVGLFLVGSWPALVWGFFVSTTLLWHGTFTINSLSHIWGKRVYSTTDDSKNNPVLAVVTMGEGWHNNHHYYPRSVRQGFHWWQIDMTYYVLRALSAVGLVWDLHVPTRKVIEGDVVAIKKKSTSPLPVTEVLAAPELSEAAAE